MQNTLMSKQTALNDVHRSLGALMVDFAGWDMPLHYGSQIEEHHFVRNDAGMFDVSHMGVVDIQGESAQAFLKYLLANNIDKLKEPGKALYSCLLNHEGGVLDDLIVYYLSPTHYRLVINAATAEKDLNWIRSLLKKESHFHQDTMNSINSVASVTITPRQHMSVVAVQGPKALEKTISALPQFQSQINQLKPFHFFITDKNGASISGTNIKISGTHIKDTAKDTAKVTVKDAWLIAKTGYTGEDGLEIILPEKDVKELWSTLLRAGIHPIGLGARDTLRLEAGLNLYGQDMDETVSPLESNLSWTVAFEPESRDFVGRKALLMQKQRGLGQKLVGLILLEKGVLRHDQQIFKNGDAEPIGKVTSGSFSPTLKKSIALARIQIDIENECLVQIRDKLLKAQIVQPPFVRRPR